MPASSLNRKTLFTFKTKLMTSLAVIDTALLCVGLLKNKWVIV